VTNTTSAPIYLETVTLTLREVAGGKNLVLRNKAAPKATMKVITENAKARAYEVTFAPGAPPVGLLSGPSPDLVADKAEFGATRVLCAASATEEVPRWRRGSGLGWVTAEYAMLPRATNTRGDRESVKGRLGGRTQEISRLVGRSLRACVDAKAMGENTIIIDCDVLQADGGTRTAAITGGYVALADAVAWLQGRRRCKGDPLVASVAAVSVGIVDGEPRLDLCYSEDVAAQTDMNVVCAGDGSFVEIQGTAEREPFGRDLLDRLLDLGVAGCADLTRLLLGIRRGAIVLILLLGYLYFRLAGEAYALVSIGLILFAAVAQFAPGAASSPASPYGSTRCSCRRSRARNGCRSGCSRTARSASACSSRSRCSGCPGSTRSRTP